MASEDGGGGGGGDSLTEDGDVEDVWGAAGMEHARAASARQCAAIDACRHAWAAEAESGGALRELVGANDEIVAGPGGRIRRGPIADAAAALRRTIDAIERAAVEFSQASKLSDVAADGWERAAKALGMAGLADRAGAARGRAGEAREMARGMEGHAARSRASAETFGQAADRWVANSAEWEDGDVVASGADGWQERRGGALDIADERKKMAEEMERRTRDAARRAEEESAQMNANADVLTAAAVAWLEGRDEPEAKAALEEGIEAAARAARDR